MRDARANVTVHRIPGSRAMRLRDRALIAAGLLLALLVLGVQLARAERYGVLPDMLTFAKENPMKLTFGNPGFGTVPHLTMVGMDLETGLKVSHLPFAGENKEIAALLGGHLMAAGIAIESCIAQVQAGQLRAIAVLQGDRRLYAFPDIPTLKEVAKDFGMKSSVIFPGLMMSGPKGLPEPIVTKLAAAFDAGRKSAPFQKFAQEKYMFQDGMPLVGQALHDHLENGYKDTGELLQKLGIGHHRA